jgi:hypothetical protein
VPLELVLGQAPLFLLGLYGLGFLVGSALIGSGVATALITVDDRRIVRLIGGIVTTVAGVLLMGASLFGLLR